MNTGTFPDIGGGSNGRQPVLLIGPTGKRHLLYEQLTGQSGMTTIPYRYGECTANCGVASSWTFTSVGDRATFGSLGKMALTPQGQPRLMWSRSNSTATFDDPYVLHYGSCDSNCTNAASWTTGPILMFGQGQYIYENTGRNLSIDGTGRAHYIYSVGGLFYMTCASNCTNASSWSTPIKLVADRGRVSLATTSAGQVKVAYTTQDDPWLGYRTCDANCDVLTNWANEVLIYRSNVGQVSLRLDSQNRPRVFFNANGAGSPQSHDTYYSWCDSNCAIQTNWQTVTIGLLSGDGKFGLDFDRHANGAVSVALHTDKAELAVVRCAANCESLSGMWSRTVVETSETVKAEVAPPKPDCSNFNPPKAPYSYWYPGEQTSVAVNPTTNKVEIAHRTYTLQSCGFSGNQVEGVTITRYSGPF